MKKKRAIWIGLAVLWLLAGYGFAQEYPNKPVDLIVPYPPGGISDSQARLLGKGAEKLLGQPVLPVNKAGISGGLAMAYLAGQKPDGYTVAHLSAGAIIQVPFLEQVTYKPADFTYIVGFGYQMHVLCVRPESPWKTFREFIEYVKKNPAKVRYASWSPVSTGSIVMDMLAKEEGIDWTHIPYKGDAPAITAILGGHVDAIASSSTALPYVRSGKLRLLAIFNSYGHKDYPDVPTLKSLGYQFPMMSDMTTSTGIIGPKGIKADLLARLEEVFTKAAKEASFLKLMESLNCPVVYRNHREFEVEILNSYQACQKILPPIAAKMKK